MGTTPAPTPTVTVAATKLSFWQKLEGWFHKEAVVVETDIKAILSSSEVQALETGFTALAKSDLGQLAVEAVTSAMNVETGAVSFSAAASALVASAKALGKSLTDSTVTTLIAAAQQKVQSTFNVTTAPAPPAS
jgi:hypothetical protein